MQKNTSLRELLKALHRHVVPKIFAAVYKANSESSRYNGGRNSTQQT
uniref:Uncharacterized protein n=1 Tax=Tetraselmis sp. GSL018 TaxID=582737 RepID=A0A061SIE6_9CHLO